MLVDPSLNIVLYVEVYHTRAANTYLVSISQHLYVGVLHQFFPDGFLCRGGEVEYRPLLLHNLKHADFRQVAIARCESHLIVILQEL